MKDAAPVPTVLAESCSDNMHIGAPRISSPADQLSAALASAQAELRDLVKEKRAEEQTS